MKNFIKYFALASLFVFVVSFKVDRKPETAIDSKELVNKLFDAVSNLKTLRFTLKYSERMNGQMKNTVSKAKIQINPRKVFVTNGVAEILWIQGENSGNALVNPGAFPYVNLNLDPNGNIMRKGGHHTIHESGFNHLAEIIRGSLKKADGNFNKYFIVAGEEVYDGRPCYKLMLKYPEFTYVPYTVKKGETLISIARKYYLSEHMILEKNPSVKWYDDVKEGKVIQIPNGYSKLTVMLIDKEWFLPLSNKIYDDLGLYEMYEYDELKINTPIAPEEFTRGYKDYHF